jgi:hypothetical protein
MQLYNRIYYSKDFWMLDMFRAAHRSSSGALNCICSLWFIYTCGDRALSRLSGISNSALTTFGHHMCIQGVSRLVDITAGGDFLGLCDKKSLYKHVSDFGRLRSYGHFLNPVHALVWTVSSESAGGWHTALGGLSFALHYHCHLTHPPSYRQSSFRISTLGRYLRIAGLASV